MKLLAIDTTTERGSVALVEAGEVRGEVRMTVPQAFSRRLLPAVEFLLESLSWAPAEIEGYAVTVGPGSFTGIRVGLSTVQGLALAAGRPCLGVPSPDVRAVRVRGGAERIVVVGDAGRGDVYVTLYDGDAVCLEPTRALPLGAALKALPAGALVVGDCADLHAEAIEAHAPHTRIVDRSAFLAGTLGLLAEPRLGAGEGVVPDLLRPLYVRPPHLFGQAR